MRNCLMTADKCSELKKENETQYFTSKFSFLNNHKGMRPGCVHLLVGTSGSGKSSLARELIIDCAKTGKVLTWLSEESEDSYSMLVNEACPHDAIKNNIKLISEMTAPVDIFKSVKTFIEYLKETLVYSEAKILFIDNITTSYLYSDAVKIQGQTEAATALRVMASQFKIPIFVIAHTQKGIFDNNSHLISVNDVRGSSAIALTAPYAYSLQSFKCEKDQHVILKVEKSRNHKGCNNRFYKLFFEMGFYISDAEVSFENVNDLFKNRNRLKD